MHAMQYEITLPADYDLDIIRRRVAMKGQLLDQFPGLALKAYLLRERGVAGSPVNQYAPFYLWRADEGANRFLWGPGFRGLSEDFGRPVVRSWLGLAVQDGPGREGAPTAATRLRTPIGPDQDPAEAIESALADLPADRPGAHTTALAVDTTCWELLTFTLWTATPGPEYGERYQVLHLSRPELAQLPRGRHW
ncbi:hypothetical protein ABH930_001189 [Kitasatospora sp. GAS204A]|uniref:DUF4865 family protein n=1 Tax=unclassified Kitasatospora TaxID=2633591 RepID=UPI0024742924|nr:DUF4865 family protein [Kitasatospora sp. GAS204B]MDH6119949.1 hypothetical protein [Kitasatospora sp. GAS204B]